MIDKISISIPHFRSKDSLTSLLRGLEAQELKYLKKTELIIINDDIENLFPTYNNNDFQNVIIVDQENRGVAAARNTAIKIAAGEILIFLDQDCIPQKNWLKNIIVAFETNPAIDALGGCIEPLRKKSSVNEYLSYKNHLGKPIVDQQTNKIITLITANSAYKTKILRSISGFNERIFDKSSHGGEDIDLTYRLNMNNYKIAYDKSVKVLHAYPDRVVDIFFKYANYGKGVRLFCHAHHLDPKKIRQPNFGYLAFFKYFINAPKHFLLSYSKFKTIRPKRKIFIYSLFDLIRYFGHGYGYFKSNYKRKII